MARERGWQSFPHLSTGYQDPFAAQRLFLWASDTCPRSRRIAYTPVLKRYFLCHLIQSSTRGFHKRFDIGRNSTTHPLPDWREQRLETLLTDKDSNRIPFLLTQRQLGGVRQWIPSLSKTGWVHTSRPGPYSESLKEETA